MATTTISHTNLGKIQGVSHADLTQFWGVKYASLGHRFGAPELSSTRSPGTIDATKVGYVSSRPSGDYTWASANSCDPSRPSTIGIPDGCQAEYGLIQQSLETPQMPPPSGTECLNLNITVPKSAGPDAKLPVVVFIHGGALAGGSANWPQYDFASLVQRSIKLGKPFIGVTIKYVI